MPMRQPQKHKLFRIFPAEAGSGSDSCSILRIPSDRAAIAPSLILRTVCPFREPGGFPRVGQYRSIPEAAAKGTSMAIEALIITLLIGAIAGWLAGLIVKGYGFGLLGNIIVGIVGAFIAALLLPSTGLTLGGGIAGAIISATLGAVILLFLISLIKRA
jgi:uncharacterized membrane protein YeaQ/YmgE (transglycosylase-associated protein family)